jgi:hypothetical protein
MESVNQLARKALGPPPTERVRLVEAILYSLDKPDAIIEQSWIAESEGGSRLLDNSRFGGGS